MSYDVPNTFSILEALLVERELVDEKRGIEKRNIAWWDMLSKDSIFNKIRSYKFSVGRRYI